MNLKKKIAIIGANEFQNPLILKAKELGYETHVFSWGFDDIGQKTADYFYSIDIKKMDEILNVSVSWDRKRFGKSFNPIK